MQKTSPIPLSPWTTPIDLQQHADDKPARLAAQAGVHVFTCPDLALLAYVTQYAAQTAACGGSLGGIHFPQLPTTILVNGSERALYEMTIFSKKIHIETPGVSRTLQVVSRLPVDWTRNEGIELIARHVAPATCCVLQLTQVERESPAMREGIARLTMREGIMRLDQWARHSSIHVMLIVLVQTPKDFAMLQSCATDLIHVGPAEEDPDYRLAFTIGSHDLDYRHCLGSGQSFVQVRIRGDRMLAFEAETHIADVMTDRVIWKCLSSGLTQAETAAVVGLDKSNVSRRHAKLPRTDPKAVPKGWWRLYADVFAFGDKVRAKLGG